MPTKPLVIAALLLSALLAACAPAPSITDQPSGEFADQGLYQVSNSGFASAYARQGVDLSSYRAVNIEPLQTGDIDLSKSAVAATLRRDWQMTPEREAALQAVWGGAMDRAFNAYERATAGEGVLRITSAMTRVAPGRPTATTVGGALQPMGSSQDVAEIFMEFRFYDEASGQLLAVIRDSRTMITQAMSRTAPVAIQTMFASWAALLHTRVSGR